MIAKDGSAKERDNQANRIQPVGGRCGLPDGDRLAVACFQLIPIPKHDQHGAADDQIVGQAVDFCHGFSQSNKITVVST